MPTKFYNIKLVKYFDRYPYVTGTSVIGMKYKDGVIFAADTGGCFLGDFILFVVF